MTKRRRARSAAFAAALLVLAGTAAGLSPADKCESSKLREAGKYGLCRLRAEARAVRTGSAPDYGKCDARYGTKWPSIESAAGGQCPSNGDQTAVQAFIVEHGDDLAAALAGGPLPGAPPDGQRLKTGQTTCHDAAGMAIACTGTGQDGELQRGLPVSYTDHGDGTITDNRTGLMWEKLSDDGSIHDKDATYDWTDAVGVKIAALNSGSFAGHADWRMPNVNELQSLVNYGALNPSAYPAFNTNCLPGCTVTTCSCTQGAHYWTSNTYQFSTWFGWYVFFYVGNIGSTDKSFNNHVRAVRGGP